MSDVLRRENRRYLSTAQKAAVEAGELLQSRFGRPQRIRYKGAIDLVTDMDHRSQDKILGILTREFPEHGVLSEEMPPMETSSDYVWVVDPLDGTTNYAHGFPMYCVSIALLKNGKPLVGVVFCPTLREIFTVCAGAGARLNGRPIAVSRVSRVDQALLATGFPYDIRTSGDNNLAYFARFARSAQAVRRAGAAALDLCYVAAGKFDGFWEIKLKCWDVAAGALMVSEAGGRVTDFDGKRLDLFKPRVVASNGRIHREMLRIIESTRSR